MLQGHDPLIIENNNKTKKRGRHSQKVVSLSSHFTTHSKYKENAAFQAQSSTNKEEEENK